MSGKIVVCRCEDVTLSDLQHSVNRGYRDIEEVKRYTGFGTGPCQGKECQAVVATALARLTGDRPGAIPPFTSRPPLAPTPLRLLARDPAAHRFADEDGDPGDAADDEDDDDNGDAKGGGVGVAPGGGSGGNAPGGGAR